MAGFGDLVTGQADRSVAEAASMASSVATGVAVWIDVGAGAAAAWRWARLAESGPQPASVSASAKIVQNVCHRRMAASQASSVIRL